VPPRLKGSAFPTEDAIELTAQIQNPADAAKEGDQKKQKSDFHSSSTFHQNPSCSTAKPEISFFIVNALWKPHSAKQSLPLVGEEEKEQRTKFVLLWQ